ncbi:hypothetical protein [Bacteroides sp. GM023]|uniref:hypothetical protein n=1 Tax=Bacteroides sp. GM023 TaxID=2723058 RepID=UPI00168BB38C|nr:hypothetical protein [Bacteroides sp. GM023]MBD3591593.1 hypothetical protein [Bacteroides sp. GM023]
MMASNGKKIETRVDLEISEILEKVAKRQKTSVYELVRGYINSGLADSGDIELEGNEGYREVSTSVTQNEYGLLKALANKYNTSPRIIANKCLSKGIEFAFKSAIENKAQNKR